MSDMNLVEAFRQTLPAAQTDADGKIRRPPEIDASTLKRLYFIRPLIDPCTQTTLSNLDIIERAMPGVDFYRNGSGKAPEDRWSDLLDMDLNNAHVVMHDLFANMKHYHGGDSPFHFDRFRQMQFTTRALISFLIDTFGKRSTPFERSLKLWDLAIVSLTKAQSEHVDDGVWCRTKSDHRKRLFTIEQQERCFHYWEIGKNKAAIKSAAKGKVTKGAVFAYFKKELAAFGIKTAEDFDHALTLRSKYISKVQGKHSPNKIMWQCLG